MSVSPRIISSLLEITPNGSTPRIFRMPVARNAFAKTYKMNSSIRTIILLSGHAA